MECFAAGGETAASPLLPAPFTPHRMVEGQFVPGSVVTFPTRETDVAGGHPSMPDKSWEGPFDVHQDRSASGASPRVLDGMQGCQYRMASYDERNGGPHFSPAYGIQLHNPRLLEYVGAPESARLLSRSPEYWLHHLGHEKTLAAALQLQHDAGLILSNVQVLQQFVTSLNRTSLSVGSRFRQMRCSRWCRRTVFVALHGGHRIVAATQYSENLGTPAVGDMQCLHVMQ